MTPEQEAEILRLEMEADLDRLKMMQAKQAFDAREKEKAPDKWYEDFGEGLAVSGMETYYGAKDLFGGMTDEDRSTLEDWRQDASESGWGTAGQVVGEIGQIAVPGGAALKGLRAANMIRNIGGGARFGADLAGGTALGFIQAPEEGETRAEAAIEGGGGAVLGGALGRVLGKAVEGIRVTPEARRLMGQGVELTPGQASESPIWRGVENVMSTGMIPTAGASTAILRDRALYQWNRSVLNSVRPPGMREVTDIGAEAQQQLKRGFDRAYTDAWSRATQPSASDMHATLRAMADGGRRLEPRSRDVVDRVMDDMVDLANDYTPEKLRGLDNVLRREIRLANSKVNPNPNLSRVLEETRSRLREMVNPQVRDELRNIDDQYGRYIVTRDATEAALKRGSEAFTPQQVLSQSARNARRTGGGRFARGEGMLQEEGTVAMATLGRREPQPLLNMRKALARNIPGLPSIWRQGGRALMGQTGTQQTLQQLGRSRLAEALRNAGFRSSAIGSSYLQEEM